MGGVTGFLLSLALCLPSASLARVGHGGAGRAAHARTTHADASVRRDSRGRIRRDRAARTAFQQQHPCPSTGRSSGACPGYVVDHLRPLKRGGADRPANMQWQTKEAARAKDKWE